MEALEAQWQRRGELGFTVGVTAMFTWLAAALPTQSMTHVNILPPLGVAIGVTLLGLYAIIAAEKRCLWLPGRPKLHKSAVTRMTHETVTEMALSVSQGSTRDVVRAIENLARALTALATPPKRRRWWQ